MPKCQPYTMTTLRHLNVVQRHVTRGIFSKGSNKILIHYFYMLKLCLQGRFCLKIPFSEEDFVVITEEIRYILRGPDPCLIKSFKLITFHDHQFIALYIESKPSLQRHRFHI